MIKGKNNISGFDTRGGEREGSNQSENEEDGQMTEQRCERIKRGNEGSENKKGRK